jgi:hypothetical protein
MKSKKQCTSWIVKAKCTVIKEFVCDGTKEEAENLKNIVDERDIEMPDWDIQSIEENA